MVRAKRKCAWMNCTNEFIPRDSRQKYCCRECGDAARNYAKFKPGRPLKEGQHVCDRTDCKIYTERLANHCNGLFEVPEDTQSCSFYKEK